MICLPARAIESATPCSFLWNVGRTHGNNPEPSGRAEASGAYARLRGHDERDSHGWYHTLRVIVREGGRPSNHRRFNTKLALATTGCRLRGHDGREIFASPRSSGAL